MTSKKELDKAMAGLRSGQQNRVVQEEMVNVDDIKVDGKNPNSMTKYQFEALKRKIQSEGFTSPIIVNLDLMIADGEHRWRAAKDLGFTQVPVKRLDITEGERLMLRQTYNKLHGTHDKKLDEEDYKIIYKAGLWEDFQKYLPGVKAYEDLIRKSLARNKDPDSFNVEKAAAKPKYDVKHGDVYALGKHRLMCGDSTTADVATLMNDRKAHLVITDPPYRVSYVGTNNPNGREWEMIENDDLRGEGLYKFLLASFNMAREHTITNPAVYCFYASINHSEFETALNEAGFKVKQILIWEKGHILGRSDYHWCHEPVMYCRKEAENSKWYGDRTSTTVMKMELPDFKNMKKEELMEIIERLIEGGDVIHIRKDNAQSYIHPTQKPIAVPVHFIRNSSDIGDNVLDLFGGSGFTLIACEQTSRNAYIMELDPKYVSAIIQRWEDFTGRKAEKIE